MTFRVRHFVCIAGVALALAGCGKNANNGEGEKIARGSDCFGCHAIDHKVVGPAYNDVSKKFAGVAGAEDTLVDAVQKGHTGTWGNAAMPPHPQLTRDQIQKIVAWVLSLNS